MSTIESRNRNGRLQVLVWAGPGEPDLADDANWLNFEDAEATIRAFAESAAHDRSESNPFSKAGAARIWSRYNAKATK